jgi:hypothetical protein
MLEVLGMPGTVGVGAWANKLSHGFQIESSPVRHANVLGCFLADSWWMVGAAPTGPAREP